MITGELKNKIDSLLDMFFGYDMDRNMLCI